MSGVGCNVDDNFHLSLVLFSGVHSAMQRPQPLAMVRPLYPQQTDALSSSVAAKIKQAVPSAIVSLIHACTY